MGTVDGDRQHDDSDRQHGDATERHGDSIQRHGDHLEYRTDMQRLHERLDDFHKSIAALTVSIQVSIAECKPCRQIVMGNGRRGLGERVTDLETTKAVMDWGIGKVLAVCGIAATVAAGAATFITHLLTKGT